MLTLNTPVSPCCRLLATPATSADPAPATHTAGFAYESPEMARLRRTRRCPNDRGGASLARSSTGRCADYNYLVAGHVAAVVGNALQSWCARVIDAAGLHQTSFRRRLRCTRGSPVRTPRRGPTARCNSSYARGPAHLAFSLCHHVGSCALRVDVHTCARFLSRHPCGRDDQRPNRPRQGSSVDEGPARRIPGHRLHAGGAHPGLLDLASFQTFGHGGASGARSFDRPAALSSLTTNTPRMARRPTRRVSR